MGFGAPPLERANRYCTRRGLTIVDDHAGHGNDGWLFETSRQSLVKVFERPATYRRERAAYERLAEGRVLEIQGHNVPQMLGCDDAAGVLELSIVQAPFVLDFGKVRIDQPLEEYWPQHVLAERWAYWESLFEPWQWSKVVAIFHELGRRHGIWLEDLHPGNIAFEHARDDASPPSPSDA
jgi:hypothetical protein